jgi:2-dehydro-3-deoxyphosphogluconate aldolase/(4S)-4-hydroxy-2-oxoglutarate aldolase
MTKDEVLHRILETKVVAVIRLSDPGRLPEIAGALGRGGIAALEVTMTTPGALEAIARLAGSRPPGGIVGAGTVIDARTAGAVIEAGADFVVSPVTDFGVIDECRRLGRLVVPGALTPTEIVTAWKQGADIVKVFPATSLGPRYFRDLRGPFPDLRLMPTGGVDLGNAGDFIEAGACAVAVGTALLDRRAVAAGDWELITETARRLTSSLRPRART